MCAACLCVREAKSQRNTEMKRREKKRSLSLNEAIREREKKCLKYDREAEEEEN